MKAYGFQHHMERGEQSDELVVKADSFIEAKIEAEKHGARFGRCGRCGSPEWVATSTYNWEEGKVVHEKGYVYAFVRDANMDMDGAVVLDIQFFAAEDLDDFSLQIAVANTTKKLGAERACLLAKCETEPELRFDLDFLNYGGL